jgi:hypothetical protein
MIRLELPRTNNADWARRACRLKQTRVLLVENTSTATGAAFLAEKEIRSILIPGSGGYGPLFGFYFDTDGPDKTQQLSSACGYNLRFVFVACEQFSVAKMQTVLGLPANFSDFWTKTHLAFEQIAAQLGAELIGPGGFDNHSSKVSVTGFGNAVLPLFGAAGPIHSGPSYCRP